MPTHDEIYQKVQATLVDALGVDEEDVTQDATLQGDLGAESIDFLDIVFRLERNFGIKIPRGELFPENVVSDPEMIEDGKLTAKGLDELKARMPYADLTEFAADPDVEQDRRPLHRRHARPLRLEQAGGLSPDRRTGGSRPRAVDLADVPRSLRADGRPATGPAPSPPRVPPPCVGSGSTSSWSSAAASSPGRSRT